MGILLDTARKINKEIKDYQIIAPETLSENEKRIYRKAFRDGQNHVIQTINITLYEYDIDNNL